MASEREIDEQIAEKVMGEPRPVPVDCDLAPVEGHLVGQAWRHVHIYDHGDVCEMEPRYFSTDINAAMDVIERMQSLGVGVRLEMYQHYDGQVFVEMNVPSSEAQEWGDTASEAICKCALKAVAKFALLADRAAARG